MKKIIITWLTILTSFIWFSFATQYELNQPTAIYNLWSDAVFTLTNWVNFNINSQYYNYMIAGSNNSKYNLFWNGTWLYFVYSYNWWFTDLKQWYIKKFCKTTYNNICNYAWNQWYSWINIDEFINNSSYTNANYFNVYFAETEWLGFCFWYESINESICFRIDPYHSSYDSQFWWSLGITRNPNLADLPDDSIKNYFTTSPFSKQPTPKPTQQTQQYTCPTIQQLIDTYPQQYNTWLCYTNSLIYSWWQFTTITPKTIFELYPTYVQLQNDINNYNNYCKAPNTQETCQWAFNWKNEEYTLISKIPQDVMPLQLYAYCNLTLNQDPNSTTCTASTWAINNGIGIDDIIDNIGKTPITVITPWTPPEDEWNGTWSVFDKYTQEEDETKRRNVIQKTENTIETMKEIYTKLTWIFRARQGKDGIVPPLITWLIALIILYKLFKK